MSKSWTNLTHGNRVTITFSPEESKTFVAGGGERFEYEPGFVMVNGQVVLADGTHAYALLVIDEESSGELWDYGLFLPEGGVVFSSDSQENESFAEKLGKTCRDMGPFRYRYDAILKTLFDPHVGTSGWTIQSKGEFEEAAARRLAEIAPVYHVLKKAVMLDCNTEDADGSSHSDCRFRWKGASWEVDFCGEHGDVKNSVGVWTAVDLLAQPNLDRPLPAKGLMSLVDTQADDVEHTVQEAFDKQSIDQLAREYRGLQAKLDKARAANDAASVERLQREVGQLLEFVKRDTYRTQSRRLGATSKTKAANAVQMRLRRLRADLVKNGLPKLSKHLEQCIIRDADSFVYQPGPNPPDWQLPTKHP